LTPIISDIDKNGNYCDNKLGNGKWIWNMNDFEKPKPHASWPSKDSTGEKLIEKWI